MADGKLIVEKPSFHFASIQVTVGTLADGTPAIPGDQVIALIGVLSRPAEIAKLDLSELQRLEDWINTARAATGPRA